MTEARSKAKRIFIRRDGGTLRSAGIPARIIIRGDGGTLRSAGIPARIPISSDGVGQPTANPAAPCTRKDGCTHVGT